LEHMNLVLWTNILQSTDLLLSHGRHDSHHQVFTILESLLYLHG
jgi:hypothetical protein